MNEQAVSAVLNIVFAALASSSQPNTPNSITWSQTHTQSAQTQVATTWRGLTVAPERRCSPYDRDHYAYPQSVEPQIAQRLGSIYSPYDGQRFSSLRETDIEHIVATSEAHDSGLCAAHPRTRRTFARDLANLTLAHPHLNRNVKRHHDAADWLPARSRCWFAQTVVRVKMHYRLTVDRAEARALESILMNCPAPSVPPQPPVNDTQNPADPAVQWALASFDSNRDGHISCAEAFAHGIAPVPSASPAYRVMVDPNHDGWACS